MKNRGMCIENMKRGTLSKETVLGFEQKALGSGSQDRKT
jgi:hypothetical protein